MGFTRPFCLGTDIIALGTHGKVVSSCPPLLTLGGLSAMCQSLDERLLRLANCLAQQESYSHYQQMPGSSEIFLSLTWERRVQGHSVS